jgi:hypothetical protein
VVPGPRPRSTRETRGRAERGTVVGAMGCQRLTESTQLRLRLPTDSSVRYRTGAP